MFRVRAAAGIGYLCDMAMRDDPVVAEVLAIRDKFAAECGNDVKEIFRRIRKREAESGIEYVSYPPRRVARGQEAEEPPSGDGAQRGEHGT